VGGFRLFEGARSSVSGVVVDAQGERMIVNFRGAGLPTDPAWLPLSSLAECDAVLADPRWPEGALALFGAARERGLPTVLDGDVADAEVFDALLPAVDFAVFSEPGLAGYAGAKLDAAAQLRHALARGCRLAAVTLGERGLLWADAEGMHSLPAFEVKAVDTTGAGDVFHGAFIAAALAGADAPRALRIANGAAAMNCRALGAQGGLPTQAELEAFLAEAKLRA
jgi:sulfofructose kinase